MNTHLAIVVQPWQSELIASLPGVVHAATRRVTGMGAADGNVGFSAPRDRADAWIMRQRWCEAAGLDPDRLVTLGQIHGTNVHRVSAADAGRGATPGSPQIGLGDALMTDAPGPVLMTLHADCQPVFLADPERRAVAVAHAGWRGTVADVVGATVAAMTEAFGSRPHDIRASLGPAIQSCCYDVGGEVVTAWRERAGSEATAALSVEGDRVRFSLMAANSLLLLRAGIPEGNIEQSTICTRCHGEEWFSHRGQGPHTGRFGAMIAIAPDGVSW
jgi:YfiH family protein